MEYIGTKEAAEKWSISERRIQKNCVKTTESPEPSALSACGQ